MANTASRVVSELRPILASLFVVLAMGSPILAADGGGGWDLGPDGTAGGYRVGDTGLWVGGYASIEVEVPQSEPLDVQLGDLGLLLRYELTPTLAFFNETDLEDTVSLVEGSGVERGSRVLLLERLYLDWAATPELTFRFGKVLTPFGIWNVIRRAPLTWTVDRPTAVENAFPDHITGLSVLYQTTRHGWSVDATAYGQAQDELVRGASDISASAAGGGRAVVGHTLGSGYVAFGTSAIAFDNRDTEHWESSYGCDVDATFFGHELTAEFAYTRFHRAQAASEWSFYVQDVIPIYGGLFGVVRLEHIDPAHGRTSDGQLAGLAWRPVPHIVVKADYQFATHEGSSSTRSTLERGFFASVTLFY
jgi:hypothetical protein